MSHHQQSPISLHLAQPDLNGRKKTTQACDSCRRRKRQCDAQRPVCSSCQKIKHECTYNRTGLKRGPKTKSIRQNPATTWTTYKSTGRSSTDTSRHFTGNSIHQQLAAMDPFSREVTDHLVELFFEHYFQDFAFFSPINFLRRYVQGTINQDLLHAVCASVASISDHPAIAKTLPSSNGQIYVDRIKSRMINLISQVSVDVIHTLIILARAEYNAGHAPKGFRLESMAIAMVLEARLHLLQPPESDKAFQSEAERIAFETGIRTLGTAAIHDWIISLVWGRPGMFEHVVMDWPSAGFQQDWWIERVLSTTEGQWQWREFLDDNSVRILSLISERSRLKNVGLNNHMLRLVDVGRLIRKFCQSVSSLGREDQYSEVGHRIDGKDSTATTEMTALRWRDVQEEYRQAQDALEHWRATLPQEMQPSRAKDMVSRLEPYGFFMAGFYYVLTILLHRPFILKACMAISSCKKGSSEKDGKLASEDVEEEELERCVDQSEFQTLVNNLGKCLAAADEFVAMIEQFTDEDIKYRGSLFGLGTFIAGTVYVIQGTVDGASKGDQPDKGKLAQCHRFLQEVGVYYAMALDGDYLLDRLSSANLATEAAMEESSSNSASSRRSAMEMLSDIVLPAPLMDAEEINNFETIWLEGLTVEEAEEWKKMCPLFDLPAEEDSEQQSDGHAIEVEDDDAYHMGWRFAPQVVSDSVDAAFSSTTTTSATAAPKTTSTTTTRTKILNSKFGGKTRHEEGSAEAVAGDGTVEKKNAFITTDSGLVTLWMHPEKMAALEEATLSSLEKLNVL